jgi:hypothetical protein
VHVDPGVAITAVELVDATGSARDAFETGVPASLRIAYRTERATGPLRFHVAIYDEATGALLIDHNNADDGSPHAGRREPGAGVAEMKLERLPFHAGRYRVSAIVTEHDSTQVADWHEKLYGFAISGGSVGYGAFHAFPVWTFEP